MHGFAIYVAMVIVLSGCAPGGTSVDTTARQASTRYIPQQVDKGVLVVEYRDGETLVERLFYSNGRPRGKTNEVTTMAAGTYKITLGVPLDYTPAEHLVTVSENGEYRVTFSKVAAR